MAENALARGHTRTQPSPAKATEEIYIRNENETEARGPFDLDQVSSLAEAGQVTAETLVYDAGSEQWVALSANTELMASIFPEKKKLVLKAKKIETLNQPDDETKVISVNEMLAAAEGRTDDTKGKSDPEIDMMRAARIGMFGALGTLVLAAAAEVLPVTDAMMSPTTDNLIAHPYVLLGLLDVIFAALHGLGMSAIYPLVRFRAALGLGLMGFIYFVHGQNLPLLAVVAGSAGLYLCTVFVSLIPVVVAAAAGVGGMGLLAWFLMST